MSKASRAAACIAVFVALCLTGVGGGLPIDGAFAADNCATAPGAAAPKGQHWYYRVDQVNHRKCWYLHAAVPLANHAAADRAAPSEQLPAAETSPSVETAQTPNAANPSGETAGAQTAPHVTVLNVKPVTVPSAGATPLSATPLSVAGMPKQTDEPPTANMPVEEDAKPARPAHVAPPRPAPVTSHNAAFDASPPARSEGSAAAQTPSARLMFPLLALALGIVGVLIAVLRKIGGSSGEPRLSEHPDDAWRRYDTADHQADEALMPAFMHQEDAPFLAPHEPYAAIDLDSPGWLDRSSRGQADIRAATRPRGKPWPSERADLSKKDIELRLRILRQQRPGVVPSGKER
jgi:hypothetical protein